MMLVIRSSMCPLALLPSRRQVAAKVVRRRRMMVVRYRLTSHTLTHLPARVLNPPTERLRSRNVRKRVRHLRTSHPELRLRTSLHAQCLLRSLPVLCPLKSRPARGSHATPTVRARRLEYRQWNERPSHDAVRRRTVRLLARRRRLRLAPWVEFKTSTFIFEVESLFLGRWPLYGAWLSCIKRNAYVNRCEENASSTVK